MASIDTFIKQICYILNIEPLNNSYVDALGAYFNVEDTPEKPYDKEVLIAAIVNGATPGTSDVLIFDTFGDFPATGDANTLYVAKDANVIYRWDDVLSAYQILNDPSVVNPDAPQEGQTFYVRLATAAALNANTYSNGSSGIGATLTATANGVLSQTNQTGRIDNTVPVVGDIILVKNEASTIKNGIYEITQVGSAGAPYILTRIDGYDETAEVYPSIVFVSAGSNNVNRYFTQNTANPVIGTNGLVYGVSATSSTASPIIAVDAYLDDMTTLPGAYTYANGTTFVTLPAYGATIRKNTNGALGTINGVAMTSGRRILINDPANPLRNGDYTVTNAGSATQRWQLTRINYANSGFNYFAREWVVSNRLSFSYGSRFSINPTTLIDAQIGISSNINFYKQNIFGLKDSPNSININAQFDMSVDDISIGAENNINLTVDDQAGNNVYVDISTAELDLVATDGTEQSAIYLFNDGAASISTTTDFDATAGTNVNVKASDGKAILQGVDSGTGNNSVFNAGENGSISAILFDINQNILGGFETVNTGETHLVSVDQACQMYVLDSGLTTVGLIEIQSGGTINLTNAGNSPGNFIKIDAAVNNIDIFAQGDVDISADNGILNLYSSDINLNSGNATISAGSGGAIIQTNNSSPVDINSDAGITFNAASDVYMYVENNEIGLYAGPTSNWYLGDFDENKVNIRRSNNNLRLQNTVGDINLDCFSGVNISSNVTFTVAAGVVDLTSTAGSIFLGANGGDIVLTAADVATYIKLQGLDTYADDAAAGVGGVPQNAIYKTAGGELRIKL